VVDQYCQERGWTEVLRNRGDQGDPCFYDNYFTFRGGGGDGWRGTFGHLVTKRAGSVMMLDGEMDADKPEDDRRGRREV